MLSPVHWGPRISASFSSEFHPEKKRMKQTQPEKAVNLSHAQGLIHFTNSILGHCFPSLSLEAGHFPKENRMVFFCLEMPSARTLIRSVSISCVSSKVLVIMVQSYHLIIMNYWFHQDRDLWPCSPVWIAIVLKQINKVWGVLAILLSSLNGKCQLLSSS